MKKSILSLFVLGTLYSNADYVTILSKDNSNYEIFNIVGEETVESNWVDVGNPYDCDNGFPLNESYTKGVTFEQEKNCTINQEKTIDTYIVYSNGQKHLKETKIENQSIPTVHTLQATGTDEVEGFIVALRSQHDRSVLNNYDVTYTSSPNWNDNFGKTKDIVINQVTMANDRIRKTGIVEWFNPDKQIDVYFSKGCSTGDVAFTDVQFLDKNNDIVAWFKTRYHSTYGLQATYGTNPNFSDGTNPGVVGLHPSLTGNFTFDRDNGVLRYTNTKTTHYVNSWSINNIDVESIRKIQLSYSEVMTTYTGETCGANVLMDVI